MINGQIRDKEVRLIDVEGEQLGIVSSKEAQKIADEICREFTEKKFDKFGIVCTKYNSMMSQEAYVKWLLPLEKSEDAKSVSAIFEPDEITVLNAVIPEYISGIIVSAVKESFACEVAARRVAMDSADKEEFDEVSGYHIMKLPDLLELKKIEPKDNKSM